MCGKKALSRGHIAILKAWEKTNIKTENTNTFLKNFGAKAIQENK